MSMEYKPPELLSLPETLRREIALDALLRAIPPAAADTELVMAAGPVRNVDVVAGTAIRLRIARHLREHPMGMVTIIPPLKGSVAVRFLELLSPLPSDVIVTAEHELPDRPRFALLPATPIVDAEVARIAAEFALEVCEAARISEERSSLVALAVMELVDNALTHAEDVDDAPVVAATVSGRERLIEVAVTDLGRGISEAESPRRLLSAIPGVKGGNGFLPELLRLGTKHGLKVSIEILAGTGRLRWAWSAHTTEHRRYVPGTTVIVRINP